MFNYHGTYVIAKLIKHFRRKVELYTSCMPQIKFKATSLYANLFSPHKIYLVKELLRSRNSQTKNEEREIEPLFAKIGIRFVEQ